MNRPLLPHAVPFLLVDQVSRIEGRRGQFTKLVTATDPNVAYDGHLPTAFVIEALAQAGGALLAASNLTSSIPGYLAAVDDFHMHGEVRIGDVLEIEVELVRVFGGASLMRGAAHVGGQLRAEGRFTLASPR